MPSSNLSHLRTLVANNAARFPSVRHTPAADALALSDADPTAVTFVDCRTPSEQSVSMIPSAISSAQYTSTAMHTASSSRQLNCPGSVHTVICYCTIGCRSSILASSLAKTAPAGVTVANMSGSALMWSHEGGTFVTPAGVVTKRLHVYGKKWDLAEEGVETVVFEDGWWEEVKRVGGVVRSMVRLSRQEGGYKPW